MNSPIAGWTQIAAEPLVLVREYSFGPGTANAVAVRLDDGTFLVVSPPTNLSARELDELASVGEVSALLANNGAHYLGLASFCQRFPSATAYATETALQRIQQKSKQPVALKPLSQLLPKLSDKIEVIAADGCKVGDVLVRVQSERGTLLYVGDFFANIPKLPWNPLFRLMFKLTKSAPGFRVFGIFFQFFSSDRAALRDFLVRELQSSSPTVMIPAHGDYIARPELGPTMISMLQTAIR
jgi:glyoxylase-like metal-dependent hydrolase (beta-lactamase superfamily II)